MFQIKFPDKLTFNNPFVVIKNQWGLDWFKINRTYHTIALGRVAEKSKLSRVTSRLQELSQLSDLVMEMTLVITDPFQFCQLFLEF